MLGVIFDMDGVIIDSHSVACELLVEAVKSVGAVYTVDEIKSWGSLSSRQFWSRVKKEAGLLQEVEQLSLLYDADKEISMYSELGPVDGVVQLLQFFKDNGIRTALATSASRYRMNATLSALDLSSYFDATVCDEEVLASKPSPEIFQVAAKKLSLRPESCVVIEDSKNGLEAATAAGMSCIGYTGSPHISEDMSNAHLSSSCFHEIKDRIS